MRKVRDLPDILSKNYSVGFVGFWGSWPAEKVRGWMVSDYINFAWVDNLADAANSSKNTDAEKRFEQTTYPPGLFKEILPIMITPDQVPRQDYEKLLLFNDEEWSRFQKVDPNKMKTMERPFKWGYLKDINSRRMALYLAENKKPEVLAVYFEGSDGVGHFFWKYMEPQYFQNMDPRELERFHYTINNYYQLLDGFIGDLMKASGPDTAFLVLSDHGMYRVTRGGFISGSHAGDADGIIIFSGPGIKKANIIQNAHILDVTPTVLYYLGMPVAKDMDGKPLLEIFTDEFKTKNPLKTIATYETKKRKTLSQSSPFDQEIIDIVKSMGYMQ